MEEGLGLGGLDVRAASFSTPLIADATDDAAPEEGVARAGFARIRRAEGTVGVEVAAALLEGSGFFCSLFISAHVASDSTLLAGLSSPAVEALAAAAAAGLRLGAFAAEEARSNTTSIAAGADDVAPETCAARLGFERIRTDGISVALVLTLQAASGVFASSSFAVHVAIGLPFPGDSPLLTGGAAGGAAVLTSDFSSTKEGQSNAASIVDGRTDVALGNDTSSPGLGEARTEGDGGNVSVMGATAPSRFLSGCMVTFADVPGLSSAPWLASGGEGMAAMGWRSLFFTTSLQVPQGAVSLVGVSLVSDENKEALPSWFRPSRPLSSMESPTPGRRRRISSMPIPRTL